MSFIGGGWGGGGGGGCHGLQIKNGMSYYLSRITQDFKTICQLSGSTLSLVLFPSLELVAQLSTMAGSTIHACWTG